mmetsp:Transcript_32397/g.62385  ORF Transcript_32397/g.62385 Transcript_32397/m.62385 type:complete len:287 (+) Transcript_32397:105-965(+)
MMTSNKMIDEETLDTIQGLPVPPHCDESNRLSAVSKTFDRGGKGFLSESEKKARELANDDTGEISPSAAIDLVKKQRGMEKKVKYLTIINIINLLALIALAITLGLVVRRGDKDTQDVIAASIQTKVGATPGRGSDAILTDKDGNVVSTVAEGRTISAITVTDPNDNANKTACVSLSDLAQMVLNNENGIKNTMSIKDESGGITSILNMDGDIEVDDDQVVFGSGKYQFVFDSPECNPDEVAGDGGRRRLFGRKYFNERIESLRWGKPFVPSGVQSLIAVRGFRNW